MRRHRPPAPGTALGAALGALLLGSLLNACAVPAPAPGTERDAAGAIARHEASLRAFDRFRVRGGLGIWNERRSDTARIDWRQNGDALELSLDAPLGLGSARLVRNGEGASLTRGNAPPLRGASADAVLREALGLAVPLPLEQLGLWLRGLPGEAREVRRDARGRLESLRWTDGAGTAWRVRVLGYTTLGDLELPDLLTANGADYRLRLVLRDWSGDADADPAPRAPGEGAAPSGAADEGGRTPRRLSVPGR